MVGATNKTNGACVQHLCLLVQCSHQLHTRLYNATQNRSTKEYILIKL